MTRWLIPWEGFKDLDLLKKEIDDIFVNRLFRNALSQSLIGDFAPATDIINKKDSIIVKSEIPGVDKKDITVLINDDQLVIKGEVKREQEINEKDYYRRERAYGTFSRTIKLPTAVDKAKVKASYNNGILEITLPKTEIAKVKELKVEVE